MDLHNECKSHKECQMQRFLHKQTMAQPELTVERHFGPNRDKRQQEMSSCYNISINANDLWQVKYYFTRSSLK